MTDLRRLAPLRPGFRSPTPFHDPRFTTRPRFTTCAGKAVRVFVVIALLIGSADIHAVKIAVFTGVFPDRGLDLAVTDGPTL